MFNEVGLQISKEQIREYWQHLEEVKFPMATSDASCLRESCPVGLYGDAAKITTEYGHYHCLGIFLNLPLWRPRSTRFSRFLVFSIKEELLVPGKTLDAVFTRLTWSLNVLFTGLYPSCGPHGEALPASQLALAGQSICNNKMKFVCTELRGIGSTTSRFSGSNHRGRPRTFALNVQPKAGGHWKGCTTMLVRMLHGYRGSCHCPASLLGGSQPTIHVSWLLVRRA